jgi:hypothetical protein
MPRLKSTGTVPRMTTLGTKNLERFYTVHDLSMLLHRSVKAVRDLYGDQDVEDAFPLPLLIGKGYSFPIEEVDAWLRRRPRGQRRRVQPVRKR